ncbi:PQQ-binding-like beta-propeller repeat protein [Maridesulfovibrio sp.]|uniref:PQQ-binding-like beta-propeller repeat protein n=1 Tax=Maridesulfovibrio sp. TaxID=2795000 RepID=UPI002A18C321|nr:PQQ-binding-like beta-propeller repeat protein [Maridesulfovibrio sp.]
MKITLYVYSKSMSAVKQYAFTLMLLSALLLPMLVPSSGLAAAGNEKWYFAKFGGIAIGSDGTVYVGSKDTNLYALESDKTEKWSYTTGGEITSAPTISSDGTIYVGAGDGKLYAVNSDGSEKWIYDTGSGISRSAAINSDGTIYVGAGDGKLHAVDSDGSQKWIYGTDLTLTSAPVIGPDGTVYVAADDYNLYAIKSDGTLKWTFKAGGKIKFSPAIDSNGVVYFGSTDSNLYALKADNTLKWKFQAGSGITSSPAIGSGGIIYFGAADNYLYALNSDGSEKWKYGTGGYVRSPAIASDGTIYVCAGDSTFYAINPDSSIKWSISTGSYSSPTSISPAIGEDGAIYFGINPGMGGERTLHAREGDSGGLADTDWPRFQKNNRNTGESESGCVCPSDTQADGVTVSVSASIAKEMDSTELATQYSSGAFSPKSNLNSFNATIDVNGGSATFRISSTTIPTGKVSDLTLMKFYNTNGTSKEYNNYALTGPEYSLDGYWWITDANGNHLARTDDTTLGTEYYIYFVIKDNGDYDEDRNLGKISDPVAVVTGSSSGSGTGCTLNPQATFSVEWLLLMLAPLLLHLRGRFKR